MPPTTSYSFGDVVLVPFPFSSQAGLKKRPAAVVSADAYNRKRSDLIVIAITSRVRSSPLFGEVTIAQWQRAGLLKPSVLKPALATVEQRLVLRRLGRLDHADRARLTQLLASILG